MSTKMDGVKISVSNTEKEEKKKKKTVKEKKTVVKKQAPKTKVAKKEASRDGNKKSSNSQKKVKKGFLSTLISIILTALIVGGAIYAWQQQGQEKSLNKLSENARESRMEFEQRLNNIKDKLTGTEKEKDKLKDEYEKLKEKADLLKEAKLNFSDSSLGISFDYPAIFGEVKVAILEGATGTSFMGEFTKNDKLVFGGISANYESDATSSAKEFIDTLGYYAKKDKYYFQGPGDGESKDYEVQAIKIIGTKNGEALVVNKKSFINQDEFTVAKGDDYVNLGENIGGLVNLKGEVYKGVGFVNSDFGMMPLEDFEKMLKSIEVK